MSVIRLERHEVREYFTLIDGTPLASGELAFVSLFDPALQDGVRMAVVLYCAPDGAWRRGPDYDLDPVSLAECDAAATQVWVLGREGQIVRSDEAEVHTWIDADAGVPGPFRRIRNTRAGLVVLGEDRSVWRRAPGTWLRLGAELELALAEGDELDALIADTEIAFGIAGTSPADLRIAGTGGSIRVWDGSAWRAEDVPTNVNLYDLHVDAEGLYTAVGQRGTVLEGRGGRWRQRWLDEQPGDFCGVHAFRGLRWLVDGENLFSIAGDELARVALDGEEKVPLRGVIADARQLLVFSGKQAFRTSDGAHWQALL